MRNGIFIVFTFLSLFVVNAYGQELKMYDLNEISIRVNNFDLLEEFNEEDIPFMIGDSDSIERGGQEVIDEFGYDIVRYCYGNSIITVRGFFIGDIFINDTRLSINNIKVGDDISKVQNEFLKKNVKNNEIIIYHGDNSLTFYYDSNNRITKIIYTVPL